MNLDISSCLRRLLSRWQTLAMVCLVHQRVLWPIWSVRDPLIVPCRKGCLVAVLPISPGKNEEKRTVKLASWYILSAVLCSDTNSLFLFMMSWSKSSAKSLSFTVWVCGSMDSEVARALPWRRLRISARSRHFFKSITISLCWVKTSIIVRSSSVTPWISRMRLISGFSPRKLCLDNTAFSFCPFSASSHKTEEAVAL